MGQELGTLLLLGVAESSNWYRISAVAAVLLAIIPVAALFFRRDPLFLFLFPVGIYIFGPLVSSLALQWTPFSVYVFPEFAVQQTWLITYAIWLSMIMGKVLGLSARIENALNAPVWDELSQSGVFRIVTLTFIIAFIFLELTVFARYGASAVTGSYTGYTHDGGGSYTDPARTAAAGAFYGVMICAYILVLAGSKGCLDSLILALSGACCVMMLLSGSRLQFVQIAMTLAFFFFWKRRIGFGVFGISTIFALSVVFLISILRGSNGASTASLLGVLLPVGEEAALNALTYNIAYSVAGVQPLNFSDIVTFIDSTLLFSVPGFLLRLICVKETVTDIQVPIVINYMRYIGNFSPVGSFSIFATVGYVFKSFFWPVTICIPCAFAVLRILPGKYLGNAVILAATITCISFWRDPFWNWWKVFLTDVMIVLFSAALSELAGRMTAPRENAAAAQSDGHRHVQGSV